MLMTFRLDWSTSMQHLPSLKIPLADPMPLTQLHVLHWKDTETGIRCMVPGEIQALFNPNMSNLTQKRLGTGDVLAPFITGVCICLVSLVIAA